MNHAAVAEGAVNVLWLSQGWKHRENVHVLSLTFPTLWAARGDQNPPDTPTDIQDT